MPLETSSWVRVNRHNLCPVCNKPDWCLVSPNGQTAICARVESNQPAGNKGAGWLHKLAENRQLLPSAVSEKHVKQLPISNKDRLNKVYAALLAELALSFIHNTGLLERGLTQEQLDRLGYKTLDTEGRLTAVNQLTKSGLKLGGVPGFWLDNSHVRLAGPSGIAIPVKDTRGHIVGVQIRCDNAGGGRYRWLSSRGFSLGCSPGTPVHVAGMASVNGEIWITEGPIKADIASLKLKKVVLAIPGVSNWSGVIPIIRELKPKRVVVAFDMDKLINPIVDHHKNELINRLFHMGKKVFEADWDSGYKGLDDILARGE
jgi:hypothetical protein